MLTMSLRDDDTQICSCHNVLKCVIVDNVKNGTCKSVGDLKSCTKAGTGCGGCLPLVQLIFNKAMNEMGQEISDHCEFKHLFNLVHLVDMTQYVCISHIAARISIVLLRSSA
jgi:NAD(P)H-nitrite reductase large subunit